MSQTYRYDPDDPHTYDRKVKANNRRRTRQVRTRQRIFAESAMAAANSESYDDDSSYYDDADYGNYIYPAAT